ncbi:hypothetical protein ACFU5D_17070 [Streptomyces anthocyanicus]|uniref:hypothetical protein n=1 Tax=Streptomyces anthocyanicus TaxID=68174 RepID=UPI00368A0DE2
MSKTRGQGPVVLELDRTMTLLTEHQESMEFVACLCRGGVVIAGWVTIGWIPNVRVTVACSGARTCYLA